MIYQYFWRVRLAVIKPEWETNKMDKSKKHIYNEHNGLYYTLIADYLSGLSNLPCAPIPPESWQRRFPADRCWYWLKVLKYAFLRWKASLINSTACNCDNSQKFSLEVVKLIRMRYNTIEKICDNSQKLSEESRMMIWKSREISI